MASTPQKDAIVFILDVNPSLWTTTNNSNSSVTLLDKGIHAITQMIHQKIIDARKTDQLALILFNTDGTENNLARQSKGEYEHVTVVQDFESPNLGTLKYLREKLVLGNEAKADIMDALIVGADLLMTMTAGKKTFQKKIFLFTDPSVSLPINTGGSDQIISQLNDHQINLNVILLNEYENLTGNAQILKEFCDRLGDGAVYSVEEALNLLQQFMTKRVRQVATFRGSLTILPRDLEIPIHLFTKTSIQRLPPAKKYSPYGTEGLERKLTYAQYTAQSETDDKTKAEGTSVKANKEELIKAFRYGRSLVPFHKIDEEQMAFKTVKSFQVLGFLSASKIDRESFMSGVYAIVAEPGNAVAQRAISALARALYEKDSVALVRYVRAENNSPKLGILQPRIKASYESLIFNILPYSEDYRRYQFASFPERTEATPEQDEAMREWILGMDLMEAALDEEGEVMEALRPGDTYNVTFQAHYTAVQNRALRPNAPLTPPEPSLILHLSTPASLLESNAQRFERLKQVFPLRSRTAVQQQRNDQVPRLWSNLSVNEEEVSEEISASTKSKAFDSADEPLITPKNRHINPSNPLPDFKAMLTEKHEDLVEKALMELMALIPRFVEEGRIEVAFECFKELRIAALQEDEFELFNTFLTEYKRQAALHSPELWCLLQRDRISLISATENAESPVTPEEADEFLKTNLLQKDI